MSLRDDAARAFDHEQSVQQMEREARLERDRLEAVDVLNRVLIRNGADRVRAEALRSLRQHNGRSLLTYTEDDVTLWLIWGARGHVGLAHEWQVYVDLTRTTLVPDARFRVRRLADVGRILANATR